jgi:hypothetical protein
MIFAVFTRQPVGGGVKQADYKQFTSIEEFVDWYQKQGDRLLFNLSKRNRSFTQNGWVKQISSPAQILQAIDTGLKMVTNVIKVVSDDGIIFEYINHSSEALVDCMALKCEIKPIR